MEKSEQIKRAQTLRTLHRPPLIRSQALGSSRIGGGRCSVRRVCARLICSLFSIATSDMIGV